MSEKVKVGIIFVCTGNTCRSPMAEYLFKDYLRAKKRSGDFAVSSAGLEAGKGDKIMLQACEALECLGVKFDPERKAKVFTVKMSLDCDLIIGMTDEHAMRCDSDNAISFRELTGSAVRDPFGYPTHVYIDCANQIRSAFDKILELADFKLEQKRSKRL